MSYEEQQADELDALQAIYPSEFKFINNDLTENTTDTKIGQGKCPKFSITVTSELNEEQDDPECDKYELVLMFRLPEKYPDEDPEIEILESMNLEHIDELEIIEILNDMIPENHGMVMIFTLVTRAFEWINILKDKKKQERKEEEERKKRELEELERKKFEGTRVTVESFIAWKLKFDADVAAMNMKQNESAKIKQETGKLTGKEMFLRDKNLIDSDLGFADGLDDGVDLDVKVDESLFLNDAIDDELVE